MTGLRKDVVSVSFAALIPSLYGAYAYGHGGGLDLYGCQNEGEDD